MHYHVQVLPVLTDNYIWIIHNRNTAIVVDPTVDEVVIKYLSAHNLDLAAIILTHAHHDHVGGVQGLINKHNPQVIDNFDNSLQENQIIKFADFPPLQVFLTPGHTYEHVCYLLDNKHLFCGDTLFAQGCGRVFTNDYTAMHNSLKKLRNLTEDIWCYPAHEYTLTNLNFTLDIDSNYEFYQPYVQHLQNKLELTGISLPTLLKDEKKYNLFLRTHDSNLWPLIAERSNCIINNSLDCLIALRTLRNDY